MRTWIHYLAAVALATSGLAAHADTISTFSLSNVTFISGATATGTVVIDTTTGEATSVDMTYNFSNENFIDLSSQMVGFNYYTMDATGSAGDIFALILPGMSLVGYNGNFICSLNNRCGTFNNASALFVPGGSASDTVLSGSLAFESSETTGVTPEPSAIMLLGTGLIGVVGAFRRLLRR